MLKISRESEINLINILIDQDVISGKDLIDIKCAARIRIDNNKPVFTFKIPIENSYGDYEFEHDIQDSIKNLI